MAEKRLRASDFWNRFQQGARNTSFHSSLHVPQHHDQQMHDKDPNKEHLPKA
jgi:hypothetical protein